MKVDSLAAAAAARGPPPSWIAPDRGFYYAQSLGEFYDGRGDSRASARQFNKKIYLAEANSVVEMSWAAETGFSRRSLSVLNFGRGDAEIISLLFNISHFFTFCNAHLRPWLRNFVNNYYFVILSPVCPRVKLAYTCAFKGPRTQLFFVIDRQWVHF